MKYYIEKQNSGFWTANGLPIAPPFHNEDYMTEELKIQTLKKFKYGSLYSYSSGYEYEAKNGSHYYTPTKKKVLEFAIEKVKRFYEEDKKIHEENLPLIEINNLIRKKIKELISSVGIPETRKESDPKSRAKYPKQITVFSGYVGDLDRYCPINDGWFTTENWYKTTITKFEKELEDLAKSEEILEIEKEKKKNEEKIKRQESLDIAKIILRYDFPDEYTWEDIYSELRKKDKYLDLAYSLLDNRNDWSNGCDYAADGLDRFKIETPKDKEIYDDVYSCIENWEGDGRIFRDCTWNYSTLFDLVGDNQLLKDCARAKELIKEWNY